MKGTKFKPGESGNPNGRPKGAKNRSTSEVQKALLQLLDDNLDQLSIDFVNLPPKDRADLLIKLARHVVPAALNPERLTVEQLEMVLAHLKKQDDEK